MPTTTQLLATSNNFQETGYRATKNPSFPTVYFVIRKQAIFQQKRQSRIQINPNCMGFQQQEVNRNTLSRVQKMMHHLNKILFCLTKHRKGENIPSISLLKVTCYGTQTVKKGQRSHLDDFQSFKEFQLHINKNRPS